MIAWTYHLPRSPLAALPGEPAGGGVAPRLGWDSVVGQTQAAGGGPRTWVRIPSVVQSTALLAKSWCHVQISV